MELLLLPWALLLLLATAPGPGPWPAAGTSPHPTFLSYLSIGCLSSCLLQPRPGQTPLWASASLGASCGCTGGCGEKVGSRVKGPPSRDGGLRVVPTLNLLEAGGHWLPGREVARRPQAQKSLWPVPQAPKPRRRVCLPTEWPPVPLAPSGQRQDVALSGWSGTPESLAEEPPLRARTLPPKPPAGQDQRSQASQPPTIPISLAGKCHHPSAT